MINLKPNDQMNYDLILIHLVIAYTHTRVIIKKFHLNEYKRDAYTCDLTYRPHNIWQVRNLNNFEEHV